MTIGANTEAMIRNQLTEYRMPQKQNEPAPFVPPIYWLGARRSNSAHRAYQPSENEKVSILCKCKKLESRLAFRSVSFYPIVILSALRRPM